MLDLQNQFSTATTVMTESKDSMTDLTPKQKILREHEEDRQKLIRELDKKAIAKGFSSFEEEERALREEHERIRIQADAVLAEEAQRTGRTVREICKERWGSQWESTPSEASYQCDCTGK